MTATDTEAMELWRAVCAAVVRSKPDDKDQAAAAIIAAKLAELRARIERTMTDPQRMIWRDDVEGICQSPDMCFEHGEHVRCGSCAIKQSDACGIQTDHSVPNLPEVYRLRRRIEALEADHGA